MEGQQRTGRVVSIGIAPWGIVERNVELLGHNRDVPCHSISSPRYDDDEFGRQQIIYRLTFPLQI